ncbi:MAG: PT domain-containing protein [Paludibacteraceae bacterium]|nr:PT domain-containing protein [Paludibacteraceae bacterium]
MKRHIALLLALLLVVCAALAGCGKDLTDEGSTTTPTAVPTEAPTEKPTATPTPTAEPTAVPTPTGTDIVIPPSSFENGKAVIGLTSGRTCTCDIAGSWEVLSYGEDSIIFIGYRSGVEPETFTGYDSLVVAVKDNMTEQDVAAMLGSKVTLAEYKGWKIYSPIDDKSGQCLAYKVIDNALVLITSDQGFDFIPASVDCVSNIKVQ